MRSAHKPCGKPNCLRNNMVLKQTLGRPFTGLCELAHTVWDFAGRHDPAASQFLVVKQFPPAFFTRLHSCSAACCDSKGPTWTA
jgi:hypothetical protein